MGKRDGVGNEHLPVSRVVYGQRSGLDIASLYLPLTNLDAIQVQEMYN